MKIITLIENLVYGQNLSAEHGLSIYIETDKKKILFDTGQTGNFIGNAGALGIDVSLVDDLVISHGHYDHTGGIYDFIKTNNKAKIHIKQSAFIEKYRANKKDFIGIPYDKNLFDNRINFITCKTEIDEGIFIIPDIKIYDENDLHFDNLLVKDKGIFETDKFSDEQFLAIEKDGYISIISGCSHNGITNMLETTTELFKLTINMILGGFHTNKCDDNQIGMLVNYFRKVDPKLIGCCHCTGIEKFSILKNILGDKVFYNYTGKTFEI